MSALNEIFSRLDLETILQALESTAFYNANLSRKLRNSRSKQIKATAQEHATVADQCCELSLKLVENWL